MNFNPHVTIYIGDFKLNPDSHHLVTDWEDRILRPDFGLIRTIPVVDIDYLGLDSKVIMKVVHGACKPLIMCTMYEAKVPTNVTCKFHIKDNVVDHKEHLIWNVVKQVYHSKDRQVLAERLKESNISVHVLNLWLQSNPTPENIGFLKILDKVSLINNPEIWLDLVSLKLTNGPSYPKYKYKKKS